MSIQCMCKDFKWTGKGKWDINALVVHRVEIHIQKGANLTWLRKIFRA